MVDMKQKILSQTLKALIQERELSVRALSRELNISQSTLNSIVSGKQTGSVEHLLKISKFFQVSMEYLITGTDNQEPTLNNVLTEKLFSGWLKVNVERAIATPDKKIKT